MNPNEKTYIVLDNIRSAFNVGSIFRTSDGAGKCEILICGISPTPDNPKVLKTSLKSEKSVPWSYFSKTTEAIEYLREKNIPIYSVEEHEKSIDYKNIEYPPEVAFVFGHEKRGVEDELLLQSDKIIHIPMSGIKRSLNVAVCAGIIIYNSKVDGS